MSPDFSFFLEEDQTARERLARALDQAERNEFDYHWGLIARPSQLPPPGQWRIWMILAGRGFGKTRAGSEWVRQIAEGQPQARIALVSSSLAEARSVMVEGESGLIACSAPNRRPVFEPSLGRLVFPNGAQARLFSAAEPEALRGPEHSHAWCDEIGKWPTSADRATRCWDNLQMGLRVGSDPKIAVTTTPRAVPLVERLIKQEASGAVAIPPGQPTTTPEICPTVHRCSGSRVRRHPAGKTGDFGRVLRETEGALWSRACARNRA